MKGKVEFPTKLSGKTKFLPWTPLDSNKTFARRYGIAPLSPTSPRVIANVPRPQECRAGNCKWQNASGGSEMDAAQNIRILSWNHISLCSMYFPLSLSLSRPLCLGIRTSVRDTWYERESRISCGMEAIPCRKTLGFGVYWCKAILRPIRVVDKSWGCERNVAEWIYGIWHRDPLIQLS